MWEQVLWVCSQGFPVHGICTQALESVESVSYPRLGWRQDAATCDS